MRLGFSTGDTVGRAGAILNVAKYLAELPVGSVIRNGCDSIDPEAAGTYLVKVPSTRSRAERATTATSGNGSIRPRHRRAPAGRQGELPDIGVLAVA
jgi:hypothetical protein